MIKERKKLEKFDRHTVNICSFLVLPLCEVNVLSFGGYANFSNSYLASKEDNDKIPLEMRSYYMFVDIYNRESVTGGRRSYIGWTNFILDYDVFSDGGGYLYTRLVFKVPEVHNYDCVMFSLGKYRKMEEKTKSILYEDSGLYYKVPTQQNGQTMYLTNHLLMAIAGAEQMKARLEANLGLVTIEEKLSSDAELWDLPKANEFKIVHEHNLELY